MDRAGFVDNGIEHKGDEEEEEDGEEDEEDEEEEDEEEYVGSPSLGKVADRSRALSLAVPPLPLLRSNGLSCLEMMFDDTSMLVFAAKPASFAT